PRRMEEGLAILRGVWENDSFSYDGKHFTVAPFSLRPKPVQKRLPIWVAGLTEKSIDRAARYGCHFAGAGAAVGMQMYDASLRKHGHDPKDFHKGALRMVHIAETRERAWEEAAPHVRHQLAVYTKKLDEAGDFQWQGGYFGVAPLPPPEQLATAPGLHFFGAPFIIGSPEDAIKEIERSHAETGTTHLVMWMQIGGMDPRLTEHSMRLFAKEVIPCVKANR
ncbi:MAG: LLM class flavin-dependent oxidoreductase, partial [Candidatus Binatia bacterium]